MQKIAKMKTLENEMAGPYQNKNSKQPDQPDAL